MSQPVTDSKSHLVESPARLRPVGLEFDNSIAVLFGRPLLRVA
jgi:hypothetical protein